MNSREDIQKLGIENSSMIGFALKNISNNILKLKNNISTFDELILLKKKWGSLTEKERDFYLNNYSNKVTRNTLLSIML